LVEDGIITARDRDSSRAGFLAAEARYNQAGAQVERGFGEVQPPKPPVSGAPP